MAKADIFETKRLLAPSYNKLNRCKKIGSGDMPRGQTPGRVRGLARAAQPPEVEGQRLLRQARPRFRAYAEAVEASLGEERIGQLREGLADLREAIEQEVNRE